MSLLARAETPGPEAPPRALDAAGLQALAAEAVAARDPRDRRGPFRPERLITSRARQAERLSSHVFRAIDVLMLTAASILAVMAVEGPPLALGVGEVLPVVTGAVAVLWLTRALGLYRFGRAEALAWHLARTGLAVGMATAFGATFAVLSGHSGALSLLGQWAAAAAAALGSLHALWWLCVRRWRDEGRLTPSIAIVGATRQAERLIADALKRRDLNVLGVFDDRLGRAPDAVAGVPVLGDLDALLGHRLTPYLDRIVVAVDPGARERVGQITRRLATLPNAVSLVVDQDGQGARDAALAKLAEAPLAPLEARDPHRAAFAKRMQDLLIGGGLLIALAPLLALIGLGVKLDSPGPVFFRQRRHGFNNEEILVWKFRTMRHEAADATAARQVTADDDRVTRFGRFLRKTSLDELPQLLNVVRGEMSLVGPRPHAVGMKTGETESARLVAEYAHRHRMKPGMTGWAAIKGSRGPLHTAADVRRRVQLDIDYIERQSFWLDVWVMLMTAPVLLGDRAAVR